MATARGTTNEAERGGSSNPMVVSSSPTERKGRWVATSKRLERRMLHHNSAGRSSKSPVK
jgi:hypothetical protein